jgi:hypothetical protein
MCIYYYYQQRIGYNNEVIRQCFTKKKTQVKINSNIFSDYKTIHKPKIYSSLF